MKSIHVLRKPCSALTVAANVLRHGTGALNVDECRIGYESTMNPATNPLYRKEAGYKNSNASDVGSSSYQIKDGRGERNPNIAGRWPANLIFQHTEKCSGGGCTPGCHVALLDNRTMNLHATGNVNPTMSTSNGVTGWGTDKFPRLKQSYDDKGGASRFFKQVGGRSE